MASDLEARIIRLEQTLHVVSRRITNARFVAGRVAQAIASGAVRTNNDGAPPPIVGPCGSTSTTFSATYSIGPFFGGGTLTGSFSITYDSPSGLWLGACQITDGTPAANKVITNCTGGGRGGSTWLIFQMNASGAMQAYACVCYTGPTISLLDATLPGTLSGNTQYGSNTFGAGITSNSVNCGTNTVTTVLGWNVGGTQVLPSTTITATL